MRTALHTPVLLEEAVESLKLSSNDNAVDGTFGGGGHSQAILEAIAPRGKLLALDKDPAACRQGQRLVKKYKGRLILINDSFSQIEKYVKLYKLRNVAGVILDLGFSSIQLADYTRGFSFQINGPLDLRYNRFQGISAAELLNTASENELAKIWRDGQEPYWRQLAQAVVKKRKKQPFSTTADLLQVVSEVKGKGQRSLPAATLVWQALRLKVNDELKELSAGLKGAVGILARQGRLVVISFHSGEDRLVKNFLKRESSNCLCPPSWPICRCDHRASLKIISHKPILPTSAEISRNPRARSARLRIAEKI